MGFNANDFDVRPEALDVSSHPTNQATTTNGHINRIWGLLALAQDFHSHGSLAGDHLRIIKRMDETEAILFATSSGLRIGLVIGLSVKDHLAAKLTNRFHLHAWCGDRHDDHSSALQMGGAECNTLGMVARARGDHTT